MKKTISFLVALILFTSISAQKKYTISGTIYDDENGETMIGATVAIKDMTGVGTSCNVYGFYSITIPEGEHILEVGYMGYEKFTQKINLTENKSIDFSLKPNSKNIKEVVVLGKKKNDNIVSDRIGVEEIDIKAVSKIPVLFGEKDVIKILTLTPGVKTSGEGSGGMFVRGGSSSQNLILLDEATVYNPNHLLGFFSTFNSDAIKNLKLYKGTAPAEYGGRLASVMDIKMKEGNSKKFHFGGSIGLISAKLNMEGPIIKEEALF